MCTSPCTCLVCALHTQRAFTRGWPVRSDPLHLCITFTPPHPAATASVIVPESLHLIRGAGSGDGASIPGRGKNGARGGGPEAPGAAASSRRIVRITSRSSRVAISRRQHRSLRIPKAQVHVGCVVRHSTLRLCTCLREWALRPGIVIGAFGHWVSGRVHGY